MKPKLIVLFGLPGAGKSYVADILGSRFGYFVYDGDNDIPGQMRDTLYRKGIISDSMRKEFTENLISSIKKLTQTRNSLVVHQTFIKEFMRKRLLEVFSYARLILVESDDGVREKRYMKRAYFNLGIEYLRHMSKLFEKTALPHDRIINTISGPDEIIRQLRAIL